MATFEENLAALRHELIEARDEALLARVNAGSIREDALKWLRRRVDKINALMVEINGNPIAAPIEGAQAPAIQAHRNAKIIPIRGRQDVPL